MARQKLAEPAKFQLNYEKGLLLGAWLLCTFHTLLAAFRYAIDLNAFQPYERWYTVLFAAAVLFYPILTKVKYPRTMYRIKSFFKGAKMPGQILLIGIFCWFLLGLVIRQKVDHIRYFKVGDWWIMDTVVLFFVVFPFCRYAGREKAKAAISWMFHIVIACYSIFAYWCLWHVFHLNILELPGGGQIGLTRNLKLMLGCHYNLTGAISFSMILLALYMIFTQKLWVKILYVIALLPNLYVALLSNSRTVYVSLLLVGFAGAFLAGWYLLTDKKKVIRLVLSGTAAIVCAGMIWWLRKEVFVWFDSVTGFTYKLAASGTASSAGAGSAEDAVRELTNLSGRIEVWRAAIKTMFSGPLEFFFGVTPFLVTSALKELGGLTRDLAHAHNIILQVGVSMGVPAMIAFIAFLIRIMLVCIRMYLKARGEQLKNYGIVPIIIAGLVLMNMAEAYLVAYFSVMACVFFIMTGLISSSEYGTGSLKQ